MSQFHDILIPVCLEIPLEAAFLVLLPLDSTRNFLHYEVNLDPNDQQF